MTTQNELLLAFYGDDFTGSTDALEFISRAGAKTVLFMEPPTPAQLQRYEGLQAIGVAGMTRSMGPVDIGMVLRSAFAALQALNPRHIHYKVCSTFDSSPSIGSIGRAIDIGAATFKNIFVPVLGSAPALGRYCVFGNLFARLGIGSNGPIYRLDRHPSMSKHPVTPTDESDLRLHLSRQTEKTIGLMDIVQLGKPLAEVDKTLCAILEHAIQVVLFDGLNEEQLEKTGSLIDFYAQHGRPFFSVGSSGVEMALGAHWIKEAKLKQPQSWTAPGKKGPVLVVSGSCSPVTAKQIAWAVAQGFIELPLDTEAIAMHGYSSSMLQKYILTAVSMIRQGFNVIIHTCMGESDKRVEKTNSILAVSGSNALVQATSAQLYGTALGRIVSEVAAQAPLTRVVIAGGDTSSYAARALGIESVEMIAPLSPGAPLCRAHAPGSPVDGIEINLKGGQVGGEDYFGKVLEGTI